MNIAYQPLLMCPQLYIQVLPVNAQESTPEGMTFNNDGTKMYVIGSGWR